MLKKRVSKFYRDVFDGENRIKMAFLTRCFFK